MDGRNQRVGRANIVNIALRLNQILEPVIKGLVVFTPRRLVSRHSMDGLVAIWWEDMSRVSVSFGV